MPYGLENIELERLTQVFRKNQQIEAVVLYGSRAKGNYKPFSDIDITLVGDTLSFSDIVQLRMDIDDLLLPYQFDISIFSDLKNVELVDHINRRGIRIYEKK